MFIRVAIGIALAAILMTSMTASAKGGFDFITITGSGSKEAVRVTDPALTEDFFAFANFFEDRTKEPADPGEGYEILRYYEQGVSARAFDRLHYYPESALVFYDGIENGESEYDGHWYTANPAIEPLFESALSGQAGLAAPAEKKEPLTAASRADDSVVPAGPAPTAVQSSPLPLIVLVSGLAALAALALLAFRRRKPSPR